jgi:hypothetical protein
MSWIKTSIQILLICFVALVSVELSLLYLFNYKEVIIGDISCKQYDSANDFSVYRKNCEIFHKHWEQDKGVEYIFNKFGRRDGKQSEGEQLIAFIGDSFTFGAMVDIEENYNYRSLHYYGDKQLAGHNYGVGGEQFHNVINKLKKQDFSKYKYIIYGLTPNDFFDLVDGSYDTKTKLSSANNINLSGFKRIKKILLSLATTKFLLHNLMGVDSAYYNTYLARQPYAGYLESPVSTDFKKALMTVFEELMNLDKNIKDKLVIVLLPQRAEVVAMRLGLYNSDFQDSLLASCNKSGLICFATDIEPLSKLDESHFPIDGHLTKDGNEIVGRQLAENLRKLKLD